MSAPILILGGTAEARELARRLHEDGTPVISSLAGRVSQPKLPVGEVRIGGFGGPAALATWLHENRVTAVIDATHPFAARISASAYTACASAELPLLRLERPGWEERPGDRWHWVDNIDAAASLVPATGERVFLTTGRQDLAAFAGISAAWFLIRCVDPPEPTLPPRHELVLARGPYTLEGELGLIDAHEIDVVVTKDSGGDLTVAKLEAARRRELPVIVVRRPARPDGDSVHTVAAALAWVERVAV
jgi:precorrin-6A/cobalt-precorrin-6A reductase